MVKAPVVKNELPPAAKGPGPKIKTRDGSKVYVTELLKSREGMQLELFFQLLNILYLHIISVYICK